MDLEKHRTKNVWQLIQLSGIIEACPNSPDLLD